MNVRIYHPFSVHVEKHKFRPHRDSHSQYGIFMKLSDAALETVVSGVHLPAPVLHALQKGDVRSLLVEELEQNSLAMRLLPHQPNNIVTSLERTDGMVICSVPVVLLAARTRLRAQSAATALLAIALLGTAAGIAWTGLALGLLLWSVLTARQARKLPGSIAIPSKVSSPTCGGLNALPMHDWSPEVARGSRTGSVR